MGDFLRDSTITFLTVGAPEIDQLNADVVEIVGRANRLAQDPQAALIITYILRYDGLGIVRNDFAEVRRAFGLARRVERVVFRAYAPLAAGKGKTIDIRLDINERTNCYLGVADDDDEWVQANFHSLSSRLSQYKNRNWIPHSAAVELFVQLVGVFLGFTGSLVTANTLAGHMPVQHSFFVTFVGFFLVYSNLWSYILILVRRRRDAAWPLISFKHKPLGLFGQILIGFVLTGLLTFLVARSWAILKQIGSVLVEQ